MERMWMQLLAVGVTDLEIHEKQQVAVGYWDEEDITYKAVHAVPGVADITQIPRPPVERIEPVAPPRPPRETTKPERGRAPRR